MSSADGTSLFVFPPGVYRGERVDSKSLQHVDSDRCCLYPGGYRPTPSEQTFCRQRTQMIDASLLHTYQSKKKEKTKKREVTFSDDPHVLASGCLPIEDCLSDADGTSLSMFPPGVYRGERRLTAAPTRHLTSVLSVPGGTLLTPPEQAFQHQIRSSIPIVEDQLNSSRQSSCPCIVDFLSTED